MSQIKILATQECVQRLQELRPSTLNYYALYSSYLNGIVIDPAMMVIPVDDHGFHRGHGVFDTVTLANGLLYRLEIHLDRLEKSAAQARIRLPFPRDELKSIILQTCALSGRRDAGVRFWLTAGPGDFGIVPAPTSTPCFYVLVFAGFPRNDAWERDGISEVIVDSVPLKPALLATIKSTNYLLNALVAMTAREKGGIYGVMVQDGLVAEGATLNLAIVDSQGVFRTPPFDLVLAGTTVRRALDLVKGFPSVAGVEQAPIRVEELFQSREVMLIAADTHSYPVVSLDAKPIGDGRPGPVCRALQEAFAEELRLANTADFIPVPYPTE